MYDLNKTEKIEKLAQVDFMLTQCFTLLAQYYGSYGEIPESLYDHIIIARANIELEAETSQKVMENDLRTIGLNWWVENMNL